MFRQISPKSLARASHQRRTADHQSWPWIESHSPGTRRIRGRHRNFPLFASLTASFCFSTGRGLFSSQNIGSPYAVYTEGRSRRRSSSKSRAGHSDNESQGSRSSRRSRHSHHSTSSRRSHCRHHSNENESEAASTHSRRRHRRRHRCSRGESTEQLVDSQQQWLEIQRVRQVSQENMSRAQSANIILSESRNHSQKKDSATRVSEFSRNQENRLRSNPKPNSEVGAKKSNFIPPEVRRFIETSMTDPGTDLQFTQVL